MKFWSVFIDNKKTKYEREKIKSDKLDEKTMRGVWLPPEYHQIIRERAVKAKLPIYKYLIMLSNAYELRHLIK